MNVGRTVFAQLMDALPLPEFRACVARYDGQYNVQPFKTFLKGRPTLGRARRSQPGSGRVPMPM